jgi:hypothetical protein
VLLAHLDQIAEIDFDRWGGHDAPSALGGEE